MLELDEDIFGLDEYENQIDMADLVSIYGGDPSDMTEEEMIAFINNQLAD